MTSLTNESAGLLNEIIEKNGNDESNLLPILLDAQAISDRNYISEDVAVHIASQLDIPLSRVSSVISFFAALSVEPRGRNVIKLCRSTACMVNKYQSVRDILEDELQIRMGETTPDGLFSLEYTECIGACDISPAFRINREVHGNLDADSIKALLNQIREVSNVR